MLNAQDTESFAKGRELFRDGLLTEAMLAYEAEAQRHPDNVEAWRMLGTVQAENDDDLQVGSMGGLSALLSNTFTWKLGPMWFWKPLES